MRKPHTPCAHSLDNLRSGLQGSWPGQDPPLNATAMAVIMNYDPACPKPRRMANSRRPAWWTQIDVHSLRARVKRQNAAIGPPSKRKGEKMGQVYDQMCVAAFEAMTDARKKELADAAKVLATAWSLHPREVVSALCRKLGEYGTPFAYEVEASGRAINEACSEGDSVRHRVHEYNHVDGIYLTKCLNPVVQPIGAEMRKGIPECPACVERSQAVEEGEKPF